jgi:MFS family permease
MLRFLPGSFKFSRISFFVYGVMIFFFILGDSTMSYMAPVVMEHKLGATMMGLILSTSSMCGTIMDFTFARFFGHKRSFFFSRLMLIFSFFFPLSFLFFHNIPFFILGMIVWGVYFEAFVFSNYHTIHETVHPHNHIWAWGTLSTLRNIGWVSGPLIASYLESANPQYPLFFALASFGSAAFLYFFHASMRTKIHVVVKKEKPHHHGFLQELRIWSTFAQVFWPLLFMVFMFEIIDSTFFSIGAVFTENLGHIHPWGGLFITMYTAPSLIFGILAGFFAKPYGKKRAGFISGLVAGGGLMLLSQVHSVELMLLTTFFAGAGMAVMYPEVSAVLQDYIARSKDTCNDIVGLTAVIASISYVIGPIMNGYLSDRIGTQAVFGLWGTITAAFSLFALIVVKRKLHIPQQKVAKLLVVKRRGKR